MVAEITLKQTAQLIQQKIDELSAQKRVTVMLTGGRAAAQLYNEWKLLESFNKMNNVTFYFGDERCVEPDNIESNYGLVMRTLFSSGIGSGCIIKRMHAENDDVEGVAVQYAALLPDSIDILLLGVGEDGHIASLFPNSSQLHEQVQLCVPVIGPKPPCKRITVTPVVIKNAKTTYILVQGVEKMKIVEQAKLLQVNINKLPVQMVEKPIWCYS